MKLYFDDLYDKNERLVFEKSNKGDFFLFIATCFMLSDDEIYKTNKLNQLQLENIQIIFIEKFVNLTILQIFRNKLILTALNVDWHSNTVVVI